MVAGAVTLLAAWLCFGRYARAALEKIKARLVKAANEMGIRHIVVTSVDRDDLDDGGSAHWASVVRALKEDDGARTVEALTPDFQGVAAEISGPKSPAEPIEPADSRFHHSYAIWAKFPKKKGDRDKSIWRVEEFLGLDRASTADGAGQGAHPTPAKAPANADVVILSLIHI